MLRKLQPLYAFVLVLILLVSLAAPVLAAYDYSYRVSIFNNSTTVYGNGVPLLITINNSQLYEYGYIDYDGLDTDAQEGAVSRPFMVQSARLGVFFPEFLGNQQRILSYRLSYTPGQTTFPIIPGLGGNFSTSDIGLGPNFTLIMSDVRVDPTVASGQYGVEKDREFRVAINETSGNVTASFSDHAGALSAYVYPTGVGTFTQIPDQVPAATEHWDKVDDPYDSPDDDTTYLYSATIGTQVDSYTTTDISTLPCRDVASVTVHFRATNTNPAYAGYITPIIYLGSDNTTGSEVTIAAEASYVDDSEELDRPGGGSWSLSDFDNFQLGMKVRIPAGGSGYLRITQIYAVVEYYPLVDVTVTDVDTTDEFDVVTSVAGGFFGLGTDLQTAQPPSISSTSLLTNLPGWMDGLDTTPFTTIDSTGHAATVTGSAVHTSQGWALDSGEYITLPAAAGALGSDNFTIQFWADRTGDFVTGVYPGVFQCKATHMEVAGAGYMASVASSSSAYFLVRGSTDASLKLFFGLSFPLDTWRLFTIRGLRVGNTTTCELYYNGAYSTAQTQTVTGTLSSGQPLYLNKGYQNPGGSIIFGDFQVWNRALSADEIAQYYADTVWRYTTTATTNYIYEYAGTSPVDDSADLDFFPTMDLFYVDSVKLYSGADLSDLILHYEPNTMVAGSTLTDRAGGDNNGTINWGTNPSTFEIIVGALSTEVSATASVASTTDTPDLLDEPTSFTYFQIPEESELTNMPLYTNVKNYADSLGMTTYVAYVSLIWITCLAMGVAGLVGLGSGWGFVIGYAVPSVWSLGTPVGTIFFAINAAFIIILGLFLWRRY